ncbi:ATP-binding cassette domain-containing protein [Campylobacter californiensis]|uniref:ATP-binding cassette domain-containing protein n=1 Tax=Campylobacter californiensis TaxID=1032243 RepID=UPI0030147BC8
MYGSDADIKVEIRSNNTGRVNRVAYEGVVPRFNRLYLNRDISKLKKSLQDEISALISEQVCDECGGIGLNKNALASRINGLNIAELSRLNVNELLRELGRIDDPVGSALSRQICEKLERMIAVGIGYLSLDRRSDTLSGGEAQRVKMVRNLGSSLSNITYIFDEPTAGLHPHDASKIGQILLNLRDNHNNILVIEHNTQMIKLADHIVELGEFGGSGGGRIIYEGDLAGLQKRDSKTAKALNEGVQINQNPLKFSEVFAIKNATRNNLKNVSVDIPKGVLVAISGVAGSGKSSLMDEFMAHYPQAIKIDQKAIGAQNRSTPATYTGVMDEIRKLFAKANGVDAGWFSPNSKGACKACKGSGVISYDMAFAEPVVLTCEECGGKRYSDEALKFCYSGLNIEQAVSQSIDEAVEFFNDKKIARLLGALRDVGLGYLSLNQPTSTLSGGENQRVKLASMLGKSGEIYVLDEPSTGLSESDSKELLKLLRRLVDAKNSVIIIEHRLSLIACADFVIDMGEGAGNEGGEVIFAGTPSELLECVRSKTARYLKELVE